MNFLNKFTLAATTIVVIMLAVVVVARAASLSDNRVQLAFSYLDDFGGLLVANGGAYIQGNPIGTGLIVATGDVGFGVDPPIYKLDVDGEARFDGGTVIYDSTVPSNPVLDSWPKLIVADNGACPSGSYILAKGISETTCSGDQRCGTPSCTVPKQWIAGTASIPSCQYDASNGCFAVTCTGVNTKDLCIVPEVF